MAEFAVWEAVTRCHQGPDHSELSKSGKGKLPSLEAPRPRSSQPPVGGGSRSFPIETEQHRDGAQCLLGHILASSWSPSGWYPPEARSTCEPPGLSKRALHIVGPQHLGTGPKGDGGKFPKS